MIFVTLYQHQSSAFWRNSRQNFPSFGAALFKWWTNCFNEALRESANKKPFLSDCMTEIFTWSTKLKETLCADFSWPLSMQHKKLKRARWTKFSPNFILLLKGQLQRFDKLSLFDRFRHVENGFDINFWKFVFVFLLWAVKVLKWQLGRLFRKRTG